jgi:hypothetical protein
MTIYTNLTIILPKAAQALAQALCTAAAGEAGAGMFVTGLSATGEAPATHFISSGALEAKFADILPLGTVTTVDEVTTVERSAGDIDAVIQLAKDAGQAVDAKTIGGLFAALDVTAQDPFAAMERLGLRLLEN